MPDGMFPESPFRLAHTGWDPKEPIRFATAASARSQILDRCKGPEFIA